MNKDRLKFRFFDKKTNKYIENTASMCIYEGKICETLSDNLEEEQDIIAEQCTGLKDKNGKFIYEGDIVAYNLREGFTDEKFNPRYSVRWSDNYMRFDLMREGKEENIYLEPFFNNKLEIVGNIHERKTQNIKTKYPPNDIRNFILSE